MRSSDNGHLTRYAPRVETGSAPDPIRARGSHRAKFPRTAPISEIEQKRRKEFGTWWGNAWAAMWRRSQTRGF